MVNLYSTSAVYLKKCFLIDSCLLLFHIYTYLEGETEIDKNEQTSLDSVECIYAWFRLLSFRLSMNARIPVLYPINVHVLDLRGSLKKK